MEWTPEAIKAEIDYRQTALRREAAQARIARANAAANAAVRAAAHPVAGSAAHAAPKRSWWRRWAHRPRPEIPVQRNGRLDVA